MEIVIMVAVADNGVIGVDGTMPWRLKSDMQRFRALTMGKPVVMGRKTFESFPRRPLPGRTNIVISRDAGFRAAGAVVTGSVAEAKTIARGDALRRNGSEIVVIGGAEIYRAWIDQADRCEVTEVHARPAGDAFFTFDRTCWEEAARERHAAGSDDDVDFSYVTWRRSPCRLFKGA
ncbi:MAG: dihydrofolate reductase [Alphaproteobacteria bacterium]|nr:dihydrofolate reductase [Alphaproteobacteria bacterium]